MGRYIFTDGTKSIDLPQYRDSAWTFYSERPAQEADELYASVAAVFRAVNRTADALASLPFALVKGKEDFDTSDDWQNKVGFMPRPQELIRLWRLSLIMTNTAYGFMEQGQGKKKLRYILPSTITPLYDADQGVYAFRRQVGTTTRDWPADDLPIVPIWRLDHTTELLPSKNTEFKAMCHAAGILYFGDDLAEGVLKRGGIPPTMLMVKGVANPTDREKMENIWDKVVRGYYKFLGKVFNADAIQTQKIGLGVEDLKDQALFDNKIADVAMAIGMPLSLLLANSANWATAQTEYSGWFRDAIVPWSTFLAGELNEHLFTAMGLKLVFRPEQTDPGQEDEVQRAQAFGSYVSAGLKPSIAAQIVGIELPEGVEYDDLDPEPQPVALQPTTDNMLVDKKPAVKGGDGSGNFDHAGRPGEVGGSAPNGGGREVVRQESPGGRAQGGVTTIGMNEGTYAGGQFLPSTELDKWYRKREKMASDYMQRKQEVSPYNWQKPPSPDVSSIYSVLSGRVPYDRGSDKFSVESMKPATISYVGEHTISLVPHYNSGERWYVNSSLPHMRETPPAKFIPSIDQYRELEHWRDMAQRKFNRNESLDFAWEAKTLPESVAAEISERLKCATGVDEIKAAFEMGEVDPLVIELRSAEKLLEKFVHA